MTFKLRLPLALVAGLFLSGCAITDEFSRRGGFTDRLLDNVFLPAESKQHRVFRSYLLIGILARVGSESPVNLDDREAVAFRVGHAVQAAKEALNCASDPSCVFIEDRIAILDRRIFRLAVAVLYPEETRDLLARVRNGLQGKVPVGGRALNAAKAAVELAGEAGGAVNELAGAVNALLDLGVTAFEYGQRLGPLYRDSIELDMRIFMGTMKGAAEQQGIKCEGVSAASRGSVPVFKRVKPVIQEGGSYCDLLRRAESLYKMGAGEIVSWRPFLQEEVRNYLVFMTPAVDHWVEASDLIWRGCDLLVRTDGTRTLCRGGTALIYEAKVKSRQEARESQVN